MRPPAAPATFGGAVSAGSRPDYRNDLTVVAGMLRTLGHNAAATPSGPVPGIPSRDALMEHCRQAQAFIRHCGDNAEHYGRQLVADNPSAATLADAYGTAMSRAATVHRHLGAALDLSIKCATAAPAEPGSPAEKLRLRRAEHTVTALDSADRCAAEGAEEVLAFTARLAPAAPAAPAEAALVLGSPATVPVRKRR
ncbi:hypothetical protein AB0F71_02015 [Kitasatospora sp. NPDC028055]|uniref:hypothetical protein n=1 Tax=Kitasatospora sp. NPDC028055 TaxID=3155653 RepID=UPI0033F67B1D